MALMWRFPWLTSVHKVHYSQTSTRPQGFLAHSDGDVAIHALCDAILGALALGDIGKHFPDTASEYENIDSRILLRHVVNLAKQQGYALVD